MTLPICALKNCGNNVTTQRGTYTFYNERITKLEAAKLCKKHGGILAPLNTQEEFEAVHKFAWECERWCGWNAYHVGLYVYKNETRFYTDCAEWDWEKHGKFYKTYVGFTQDCWIEAYRPKDKIQKVLTNDDCSYAWRLRTICFNAKDVTPAKAEAVVQSNGKFASFNALTLLFAVVAFGTVVVSLKKFRKYKSEITELKQQIKI